jgi:hypothetical protein
MHAFFRRHNNKSMEEHEGERQGASHVGPASQGKTLWSQHKFSFLDFVWLHTNPPNPRSLGVIEVNPRGLRGIEVEFSLSSTSIPPKPCGLGGFVYSQTSPYKVQGEAVLLHT